MCWVEGNSPVPQILLLFCLTFMILHCLLFAVTGHGALPFQPPSPMPSSPSTRLFRSLQSIHLSLSLQSCSCLWFLEKAWTKNYFQAMKAPLYRDTTVNSQPSLSQLLEVPDCQGCSVSGTFSGLSVSFLLCLIDLRWMWSMTVLYCIVCLNLVNAAFILHF